MSADAAHLSITCPLCKGKEFQSAQSGLIVKSAGLRCLGCQTLLGHAADVFWVKRVGPAYSNCARLLRDRKFSREELAAYQGPVHTDAALADLARGNIPEDFYEEEGGLELPIPLQAGERVIFLLHNAYAWDERSLHTSRKGAAHRPASGIWFEIHPLPDPKFTGDLDTLDAGTLLITDRRYAFAGARQQVAVSHTEVKAVFPYQDGAGVVRFDKVRVAYFKGFYHWPLIASTWMGLVKAASRKPA